MNTLPITTIATVVCIICINFSAWATHVIYCFLHELWLMLLVGALAFPLGIAHGGFIWFKTLFM